MNKNDLKAISALFVLNFGLFSCAKDKTEETAKPARVDNFRLAEPVVHAQFKSNGTHTPLNESLITLNSKLTEGLDPTSIVEIPSLKNHNFTEDPIELKVRSLCTPLEPDPPSRDYKNQLLNAQSFKLLNILDPIFIIEMSSKQKTAQCALALEFVNKNGSTEVFKYNEVLIAPLSKDQSAEISLILKDQNDRLPIVEENRNKYISYPLMAQTNFNYITTEDESVFLVCDNFMTETLVKSKNELILSQLARSKIIWQKPLSNLFKEVDSRVSKPAQDCRVMIEFGHKERSMKFSRQFRLLFKTPDLKIKSELRPNFFATISPSHPLTAGDTFEVLHLDIFNPNDYPATLAIPYFNMQVLAISPNLPPGQKYGYAATVKIFTEGSDEITQNSFPGKVMNVVPGAHLQISYRLGLTSNCQYLVPRAIEEGYPHNRDYSEVYLRILNDLAISQVANPILDKDSSKIEIYKLYEHPDEGSLPNASWRSESAKNMLCFSFLPQ